MNVQLKAGDVFLTRGTGWVSRLVRVFTQTIGEKRTRVNHVGLIVEDGDLRTAVGVEAIRFVTERTLWSGYGPPCTDSVAVYRATNLTPAEVEVIAARAKSMVGRKYGFVAVAAHLLDWFLLGMYWFRRLVPNGRYPICSWVVADAFAKVGKNFGVPPGAAQPDDIWDFVNSRRHDHYVQVFPLGRLG
jgi:hypothetical protein